MSNAIPYLPSLKEAGGDEPCTEMAKVYIYKKIWNIYDLFLFNKDKGVFFEMQPKRFV